MRYMSCDSYKNPLLARPTARRCRRPGRPAAFITSGLKLESSLKLGWGQAERLTEERYDLTLLGRLDDGCRVALVLSHFGLVLRKGPPRARSVSARDWLAGGAVSARARSEEDNVELALLKEGKEFVVGGDPNQLRASKHRRQHRAGALRHDRIAPTSEHDL